MSGSETVEQVRSNGPNMFDALSQKRNRDTLLVLVFTTMCMFTLPIAAYFYTDRVLIPSYGITEYQEAWAMGAGVCTANFIIFCYVVYAFLEKNDDDEPSVAKKKD